MDFEIASNAASPKDALSIGSSMKFEISYHADDRIVKWLATVCPGYKSGLELGCGIATYLSDYVKCDKFGGIELYAPYAEEARSRAAWRGATIYEGNILDYQKLVPKDTYDLAIFIDSLEHLPKKPALTLLNKLKKDFKRIAIFCPEGHHENPNVDGNDLNYHLSEWTSDEMRKLGFKVRSHPKYHFNNIPEKQGAFFAVWSLDGSAPEDHV